ncbi:hypothetical protein [Anaerotignum sp. MB30-C6]|uniref:hypothetical protein n=1 Tax=Anaerotignum sp. MB30-C6 TaxID=3070814 RepID=UPI0027DE50B2|nr:hypothetical protein [Anaerotignum sp. MB30-C6]WMI80525.1 hypothetical protein RBQ60_11900 [Anaerotignum sp. MB30-C6]
MLNNQVGTIEKQWNKKEVRKNTNKLARGILVYEFIMLFIVIADMIRRCIPISSDNEALIDSVYVEAMNSGTPSLIAVFLGLLFLLFYFRKYNYQNLIFPSQEKMTGFSFLGLITIFMSVQAIFSLSGAGIETCLNHFGYSILVQLQKKLFSEVSL